MINAQSPHSRIEATMMPQYGIASVCVQYVMSFAKDYERTVMISNRFLFSPEFH